MILVIGSYFQGKKEYVKSRFSFSENDFSEDIFSSEPVLIDFQNYKGKINERDN